MFESVDGRSPARWVSYKLTMLAFGSGELKSDVYLDFELNAFQKCFWQSWDLQLSRKRFYMLRPRFCLFIVLKHDLFVTDELSPYLTVMRRFRDCLTIQFPK